MLDAKAVIFDMDGVLFDTERLCTVAWQEVAARHGLPNIEEPIMECVGRNEFDTIQIMKATYGAEFPYDAYRKEVCDVFYRIIDTDGMPMLKGVNEILSYLKDNGYRIALASSSKEQSVRHHLAAAGLTDAFELLITGDMVLHGKPDPEIYRLACEKLAVAPQKAIAIEDSYNGIRAAYAAGMKPIMVPDMLEPTDEMREMSYAICESLLDVIRILE